VRCPSAWEQDERAKQTRDARTFYRENTHLRVLRRLYQNAAARKHTRRAAEELKQRSVTWSVSVSAWVLGVAADGSVWHCRLARDAFNHWGERLRLKRLARDVLNKSVCSSLLHSTL
jgi:hypothetical protein